MSSKAQTSLPSWIQHLLRTILTERSQPVLTLREIGMVRVMERITDMPDWHKKVSLLHL